MKSLCKLKLFTLAGLIFLKYIGGKLAMRVVTIELVLGGRDHNVG